MKLGMILLTNQVDNIPYGVYNPLRKAGMIYGHREKCCCCERKKQRQDKEVQRYDQPSEPDRGTGTGIKRMVEDAYCTDILVQVSAVNAALNSFNKVLLANHIKTCVRQDILDGKEETVDDLVVTLQKLMK